MMLPERRPAETVTVEYENERYHISVGFYPDTGHPAEVWAYGPKVGNPPVPCLART